MKILQACYELICDDGSVMTDVDKIKFRNDSLKKIEVCARESHQSLHNDCKSYGDFVKGIVKVKHLSVLRHVDLTVHFRVDRGITHELVRHGLAHPTQESTRYVKYDDLPVIDIKPGMELDPKVSKLSIHLKEAIIDEWVQAMLDAERHYTRMIKLGATPQMARGVIPNSMKSGIYITANLEEWLNILKQRCAKDAHPQMREVMVPLYRELHDMLPEIYTLNF